MVCFSARILAFTDTLYINSSAFNELNQTFHGISFNATPTFEISSKTLVVPTQQACTLTIVNTDSLNHTFQVNALSINQSIAASSSETIVFTVNQQQVLPYFSSVGTQCGAAGILIAGYASNPLYTWNLAEFDTLISKELAAGNNVNIDQNYRPQLFTINGKNYPNTLADTSQYVQEQVGDSIYIAIYNSGLMSHSLHFHGYHVEIVEDSENKMTFWEKDTFPVLPLAYKMVLLVPDKPGEFPVHDHNLIAVTNSGVYPGGMITYLNISP